MRFIKIITVQALLLQGNILGQTNNELTIQNSTVAPNSSTQEMIDIAIQSFLVKHPTSTDKFFIDAKLKSILESPPQQSDILYEPQPIKNIAIPEEISQVTSTPNANIEQSDPTYSHRMQQQLMVRDEPVHYRWPCRGEVIVNFSDAIKGSKKKIDHVIIVTHESEIKTAAEGDVIYAKWMPDLGLTIILSHGNHYNSIYANCDRLLVTEGDHVQSNQKIAEFVGKKQHSLYFSVHHKGHAIHPKTLINKIGNDRD